MVLQDHNSAAAAESKAAVVSEVEPVQPDDAAAVEQTATIQLQPAQHEGLVQLSVGSEETIVPTIQDGGSSTAQTDDRETQVSQSRVLPAISY